MPPTACVPAGQRESNRSKSLKLATFNAKIEVTHSHIERAFSEADTLEQIAEAFA
jgi:hypothetical protein